MTPASVSPRDRTRRLLKSSITKKIGLLLLLPFLTSLAVGVSFMRFLSMTGTDVHFINVAGRQRMLASELGAWEEMVALGQREDRPGLRRVIRQFDDGLTVLQRGGEVDGRRIAPAPAEVLGPLKQAAALWATLKPELEALAGSAGAAAPRGKAYHRSRSALRELRERCDAVVTAEEVRSLRLGRRMAEGLAQGVGLNLAVLLLGLFLARRDIARPIRLIGEAAQRISGGDFSQRLAIEAQDELEGLVQAFNDMAANADLLVQRLVQQSSYADTIIASMPVGLAVLEADGQINRVNRMFCRILEVEEASVRGRPFTDLLPHRGLGRAVRGGFETGQGAYRLPVELPGKSLRVTVAGTALHGGRLLLMVEDCSEEKRMDAERRRAEDAIRESEERFRQIAETIEEVFWMTDPLKNEMLYVSPAYEKIWGRSRESLYADPRNWLEAVHVDDRARVLEASTTRQVRGDYCEEYRIVRPDGTVRWIRDRAFPIRDASGKAFRVAGVAEDVTSRVLAEEKFRIVLDGSPDTVVVADERGRIVLVNRSFERTFGYAREELEGLTIEALVPERFRARHAGFRGRYLAEPKGRPMGRGLELFALRKDGREFPVDVSVSPLHAPERLLVIATIRDLSETRLDQLRLTRANRSLRILGELNQGLARGLDEHELVGLACRILVGPSGQYHSAMVVLGRPEGGAQPSVAAQAGCCAAPAGLEPFSWESEEGRRLAACARAGRTETVQRLSSGEGSEAEQARARACGYASCAAIPLLDSDGRAFGGLLVAAVEPEAFEGEVIDHLREFGAQLVQGLAMARARWEHERVEEALGRKEEQLRQSQKMEAVGRLAGGIAHDFNNLLTAIMGYADFLAASLGPDDPRCVDVEEIRKAGGKAASLTRQMLAFSRKEVLQMKMLDLNAAASDMEKMLARLIGEDIELVLKLGTEPLHVCADKGYLQQVILNLAVNARDAMPGGGRLTIETSPVELTEPRLHKHGLVASGRYAMLAFSDTGCGMGPEVQEHLFEPFFTTKEVGKGTGLGLSTVYGIITQSRGFVAVDSEPGCGATFKIYLPRVEGPSAALPPPGQASPSKGSGTILLVEDEPALRELARRILAQAGFKVLPAAGGEAALEVCRSHEGPIDLVLTDMVMPRMSGPELAKQVSALRPGARIVFMSGYTEHSVLDRDPFEHGQAFIQKPFSSAALVEKVLEALSRPSV